MLAATIDTMGPFVLTAVLGAALAAVGHLARRALSSTAAQEGAAGALPSAARRSAVEPLRDTRLTSPRFAAQPPLEPPVAPVVVEAAPEPAEQPNLRAHALMNALRARMDEVSYEPGAPNVLAMTKRLDREGDLGGDGEPGSARFSLREEGGRLHLRIEGALDALAAADLRPHLDAAVATVPFVSVDLSGVELVDSSGVAALTTLARRCQDAGGAAVFQGLRGQPLSVFKLLKLDRVLTLS